MRDEGRGAHSPRCFPCCVRTPRAHSHSPRLVRTPPCSFVTPALICTLLCSVVFPRAYLYPPALLHTPPAHPLYLLALVFSRCCRWCWCSHRACSCLVCAGTHYPVAFIWPLFTFTCAHSCSFELIYLYQMQS